MNGDSEVVCTSKLEGINFFVLLYAIFPKNQLLQKRKPNLLPAEGISNNIIFIKDLKGERNPDYWENYLIKTKCWSSNCLSQTTSCTATLTELLSNENSNRINALLVKQICKTQRQSCKARQENFISGAATQRQHKITWRRFPQFIKTN